MVEIYKALNVIMAFHILLLYPTLVRQCGDDDDDGGDDGEDHGNGDYKPCPAAKPSLISTFVEP